MGFYRPLTRLMLASALFLATTALAQAETLLKRGNGAEPESIDPHVATGVSESFILFDIFEGLVVPSSKAEPLPGAAESWTISEDGLTYTFKMRQGATWSDGSPVSAEDFVYSWQRLVNPATASDYAYFLDPVKGAKELREGKEKDFSLLGAKAVDAQTFVVTLNNPTPYFLQSLMHQSTYPVPKAAVEKYGKEWTKPGNIITNGAFTVAEWVPQGHIKLVKNAKFHDAAAVKLDGVMYYPTEDTDAELKQYRAGELHITYDVPSTQIKWAAENLPGEFRNIPYLGTYFYAFNTSIAPFNDPKVRKALSLAIDRTTLMDKITQGGEIPAYGWVPPGLSGYEQQQVEWASWDQAQRNEEAKKLLAEAGFTKDNPLKMEVLYNTSENHKKIAVAISGMWKQVLGVETSLRNEEWKVYLESRDKLQFQTVRAAWIGDYRDPNTFISYLRSDIGEQNPSAYKNKDYDQLAIEADKTNDAAKRFALMAKAEQILLNDHPFAPIYFYSNQHIVSKKVQGWDDNIMDWHPSRFISLSE
jgi:oligopeptide transport system substrate-binding protein